VGRPQFAELQNDRVEQFQRVIKDVMKQARQPQMVSDGPVVIDVC